MSPRLNQFRLIRERREVTAPTARRIDPTETFWSRHPCRENASLWIEVLRKRGGFLDQPTSIVADQEILMEDNLNRRSRTSIRRSGIEELSHLDQPPD
jgi:hypothetical protein